MNESRSVVFERELPHRPEKVWRALTQPHLIAEWLGKMDFAPVTGHRGQIRFDWGAVDCQVRVVEENRRLSYSWDSGDLKSVVTWSLVATPAGTRLHLEQSGFKADQPRYFGGARAGWPRFLDAMAQVLERMDDALPAGENAKADERKAV